MFSDGSKMEPRCFLTIVLLLLLQPFQHQKMFFPPPLPHSMEKFGINGHMKQNDCQPIDPAIARLLANALTMDPFALTLF